MSDLDKYKSELITHSMAVGALKFGDEFVLKSGRISPYFFNAGLLCTGPILQTVSSAYAHAIHSCLLLLLRQKTFDVLFGPAYKGIPFAATTALALFAQHAIEVSIAYDRKEAKDHGEGGRMVGAELRGKRVIVLDDVMTSGRAVRGAIEGVTSAGGEVVGVVQLLDREEVGSDGKSSTVEEIEGVVGKGRVVSVLKMADLMAWLEQRGMKDELQKMRVYRDAYGLK